MSTSEDKIHYKSFEEALVERGTITAEKLEAAKISAEEEHISLERYLITNSIVDTAAYVLTEAAYFNLSPMTLPENFQIAEELAAVKPTDFWMRVKALPMTTTAGWVTLILADPFDLPSREEAIRAVGGKAWVCVAAEKEVIDALTRFKAQIDAADPALAMETIMKSSDAELEYSSVVKSEVLDATLETSAGTGPVICMVNRMIIEALKTGASDIHFEAMEKTSRLRYRIDGELVERPSPPKVLHMAVVSRIKIMSNLNISEQRVPQDGRFKVRALRKEIDVRVSILPTVHGEKVVMRILDKANLAPGLAQLGLDSYAYEAMKFAIAQPHGIILSTGPTGSGKTTTLYSCLQDLNKPGVNIVTAEDPVEYELPGINQVHVNGAVGLTFAGVLRSVLRQDPDVILVGEIRDDETADIAVKAALTGHLVLSTLHTNDAPGAIVRLNDMGVPPFLISSSLVLAQAQRLFRKLCPYCKKPVKLDEQLLHVNHVDVEQFRGVTVYGPEGCTRCHNSGYKGRGAFMEVMPVTNAVRQVIERGSPADIIRAKAVENGMITLKEAAMRKVQEGVTSFDAAFAVVGGE